jgi:hypothetical protein
MLPVTVTVTVTVTCLYLETPKPLRFPHSEGQQSFPQHTLSFFTPSKILGMKNVTGTLFRKGEQNMIIVCTIWQPRKKDDNDEEYCSD